MDVMERHDVIVIGGGLIGLTIAWRAAQRGLDVLVLERDACAHGATRAAAGMLAPIAEIDFGTAGESLLALGLESAAAWPAFADELAAAIGEPSRLRTDGTLILARDRDEAEALERQLAHRERLGLPVERLLASEARRIEPALVPSLRMALSIPTEASVDPRWVCDALLVAMRAAGAELREGAAVASVTRESGIARGVELESGERLAGEHVVLATGAWAGALANVPVRPVKGQIMLLRDPEGEGLVTHTLRFEHGYLVPRADGIYALGASAEERGFDLTITARPLYELLRDASELVPALLDLEVAEISAGLRPGSPDNLPLIGTVKEDGLILACGHYRNGILLAPLTATMVLDAIAGAELPAVVAPARHAHATVLR
jgi:glycine oxidase